MYGILMVTFTIDIPQMLAYIPYMDPMGFPFSWVSHHPNRRTYTFQRVGSTTNQLIVAATMLHLLVAWLPL